MRAKFKCMKNDNLLKYLSKIIYIIGNIKQNLVKHKNLNDNYVVYTSGVMNTVYSVRMYIINNMYHSRRLHNYVLCLK